MAKQCCQMTSESKGHLVPEPAISLLLDILIQSLVSRLQLLNFYLYIFHFTYVSIIWLPTHKLHDTPDLSTWITNRKMNKLWWQHLYHINKSKSILDDLRYKLNKFTFRDFNPVEIYFTWHFLENDLSRYINLQFDSVLTKNAYFPIINKYLVWSSNS